MAKRAAKVLVVGSLNIDFIASVQRLPAPGETVPATGLVHRFGGKGANQAVAAVRQGAAVSMLGCVGVDDAGRAYCARLRKQGIDASAISTTNRALTGTALIAVDRLAENMIIVAAGANGCLQPAAVRRQRHLIAASGFLLLQFEIPIPAVVEAIILANRAKVPVVLNPSPLREGFPWGTCALDTLIVNGIEAKAIFRLDPAMLENRVSIWQKALAKKRIAHLIITRGAKPTLCVTSRDCFAVPTLRVRPVDTVGAGDAFAGTYAARRAEGLDFPAAVGYANCAGAMATLKPGAQESIPGRALTNRMVSARTGLQTHSGTCRC
jgi:ribokinase